MVQSINKPLWPMALVHGALKWWMREYFMQLGSLFLCKIFCGLFTASTKRALLFQNTLTSNVKKKKKKMVPHLTLLIILCVRMGWSKFIHHPENVHWWLNVLHVSVPWFLEILWRCTMLWKSYYQDYATLPSLSSHFLLRPASLPTALHAAIVIEISEEEQGQLNIVVSLRGSDCSLSLRKYLTMS